MTREHPDELTPREREVLDLVRLGLTNEEIAARLGISLDGAKYHVSQILSKLGVTTREEAAAVTPAPRRRWWAALPLAVKAASVAVVLAAVGGLGLLAWGVFQMSGDEENALVGGTTGPILSEDSAIDVAEQYMTATYGGANSCSSANVNPSSRMWSVGCYHASGDDCEGITQGTGECSLFDVVRVSARRVLVDPSTGTASERSTPVSVAGPVIAAVRDYLSTTRLDDREYDLPPPYFCGWFSNPTPSPPVVCLDTRTLFSESSADVEMLSQDGGRWSLTVERRGEEWAVTVVNRLGQETGPRIGDHWHAPYSFTACGEKQPNAPVWEGGVHTHGDGIIHIHPFQSFEEGPGASLVKWFEYGGGLLTETEIKIPGSQETFRNGDLCPDGEPGELQVFVTPAGEASEERLEGDALMQYIPHDGDRIRIVFGSGDEPQVYEDRTIIPPELAARIVDIAITDDATESGTRFEPDRIEITAGEVVKFAVRNTGVLSHGFRVAGEDGEYGSGDDFVVSGDIIPPGAEGITVVRFNSIGETEFRDDTLASVVGVLVVADAQ